MILVENIREPRLWLGSSSDIDHRSLSAIFFNHQPPMTTPPCIFPQNRGKAKKEPKRHAKDAATSEGIVSNVIVNGEDLDRDLRR